MEQSRYNGLANECSSLKATLFSQIFLRKLAGMSSQKKEIFNGCEKISSFTELYLGTKCVCFINVYDIFCLLIKFSNISGSSITMTVHKDVSHFLIYFFDTCNCW